MPNGAHIERIPYRRIDPAGVKYGFSLRKTALPLPAGHNYRQSAHTVLLPHKMRTTTLLNHADHRVPIGNRENDIHELFLYRAVVGEALSGAHLRGRLAATALTPSAR